MAVYPRGGIWWCKFEHRGRAHYESTHVRVDGPGSKRAAQDEEIQIKSRVVTESGQGGKGFADEACLGDLEQLDLDRVAHKDERAKADIKYFWKYLFKHLGGEHRFASTLTLVDIARFEAGRRKDGATPQTYVRERQTLVRGLKLGVLQGLLDRMPFDPVLLQPIRKAPKHKRRRGVLHTEERINEVLMCISVKGVDAGHRDIARFVQLTGLRSSELKRAADFDVQRTSWGGILFVESAKEGEPREIPLTHEAVKIYDRWHHRFATADIAHSLTRASRAAGGDRGVTLRDLRKYYLSTIARRDPTAAQKLGGHTNIKTTGVYIEASQDAAVAAVLAAFQPVRVTQPNEGVVTVVVTEGKEAKSGKRKTSKKSKHYGAA